MFDIVSITTEIESQNKSLNVNIGFMKNRILTNQTFVIPRDIDAFITLLEENPSIVDFTDLKTNESIFSLVSKYDENSFIDMVFWLNEKIHFSRENAEIAISMLENIEPEKMVGQESLLSKLKTSYPEAVIEDINLHEVLAEAEKTGS